MRHDLKFVILSLKAVLEEFVLRSLRASPLIKPFFNAWWVAGGKMCVLKGFSRLVMCSDFKDQFISESF